MIFLYQLNSEKIGLTVYSDTVLDAGEQILLALKKLKCYVGKEVNYVLHFDDFSGRGLYRIKSLNRIIYIS